jgi:putative transposase
MSHNPHKHHRRSIRLQGYDYSRAGLYFITICCQHRAHLFGAITDGQMMLNEAGQMVEQWYYELENKFPNIKCHEMIVMPNHFHCIVEITVGSDLRVCPYNTDDRSDNDIDDGNGDSGGFDRDMLGEHVDSPQPVGLPQRVGSPQPVGSPIPQVVQWFKTMTTNEYIRGVKTLEWQPFDGKLWQRNYYEHIIRNQQSYQRISEYIKNNPIKWKNDTFYDK